jgi:hypothetical protein
MLIVAARARDFKEKFRDGTNAETRQSFDETFSGHQALVETR